MAWYHNVQPGGPNPSNKSRRKGRATHRKRKSSKGMVAEIRASRSENGGEEGSPVNRSVCDGFLAREGIRR